MCLGVFVGCGNPGGGSTSGGEGTSGSEHMNGTKTYALKEIE